MSFVSTFLDTRLSTNTGWAPPPRERREPAAEPGAEWRCPGHRADCAADHSANYFADDSADYSALGDMATGSEVAELLRVTVRQPVSLLAHWIVDRRVIALSCGAGLLLPLFQFDFAAGCVRSGAAAVLSELAGAMTDDEVARWFAQPNTWLNGAVPARTLMVDLPAVLAAARADRFVARG